MMILLTLTIPLSSQNLVPIHLESGFVLRLSPLEWQAELTLRGLAGELTGVYFRFMEDTGVWSPRYYWDLGMILEPGLLWPLPKWAVVMELLRDQSTRTVPEILYAQILLPLKGQSGWFSFWSGTLEAKKSTGALIHPIP